MLKFFILIRSLTGGGTVSASRAMPSSGSQSHSRDSSREGRFDVNESARKPAPTGTSHTKRLSEEEMRKEARLLMEEFLHNVDMKV